MMVQTSFTIPTDHPAFAGHFPGTPIVPGVLLLDAALYAITQSAGIAAGACYINSVKFLSPLKPGESVVIDHELQDSGSIRFEVLCGERKIVSGSLTLGQAAQVSGQAA